jgi:hypothetical protein
MGCSFVWVGIPGSSTAFLMLTSRQKSGQRDPPSLTLNRLLQFSRQAQTAQFCRSMALLLRFLLLREQVDDFIAANQAEVFAGNAFHVAPVGFERHDLTFQFFVVAFRRSQNRFDFAFILPEFMNAQQPLVTENGEEKDKDDASRRDEVHPFLEGQFHGVTRVHRYRLKNIRQS